MGASLRAAARQLRPIDREALVFLADMPWLSPRLAARLVGAARSGDGPPASFVQAGAAVPVTRSCFGVRRCGGCR